MAVANDFDIANLALDILGVTQKMSSLADSTKEAQAANRWYATCRDLVARAAPWRFNKRQVALSQHGAARATITLSSSLATGESVTVDGVTLTAAVTATPGTGQFAIPESPITVADHLAMAAQGLATAINADTALGAKYRAWAVNAVVTVSARLVGAPGTTYTISASGAHVAVSSFSGDTKTDPGEWAYTYDLPTDFLKARRIASGNRLERAYERAAFDLMLDREDGTDFVLAADVDPLSIVLEYTAQITAVTKFPDHFVEALAYRLAAQLVMPLAIRVDMARIARDGYRAALADAWTIEVGGFQPDAPPDSEFIGVR